MAKKTFTHSVDSKGKVAVKPEVKPTRAQRKSTETLIPLTPAPKTRAQKVARALWG